MQPAEDDNSMVTVSVDNDEFAFEAEGDLVTLLRSGVKSADGGSVAVDTSDQGAARPSGSSSGPTWAPKKRMKGPDWAELSPGQSFTQLQHLSSGGRTPSIRIFNHVLDRCLQSARDESGDGSKALAIAVKTLQHAKVLYNTKIQPKFAQSYFHFLLRLLFAL